MRTHMLTRTPQVSWRPGLLLLIRHGFEKDPGPYLRTTESKARRLGTYTCIYKELLCDFLCIPQLKGNTAFHNIRYTQSKVTFKFPLIYKYEWREDDFTQVSNIKSDASIWVWDHLKKAIVIDVVKFLLVILKGPGSDTTLWDCFKGLYSESQLHCIHFSLYLTLCR